jgi:type VI secretion system secreted protein VgrG
VRGLESATVVGPGSEEIHTDEYARVRVHFHWDRESQRDEASSCWIPTNQPWAGAGFGAVNIPRIGQEVLVEFLGDDPDRPVVLGRVFTEQNPPRLPDAGGDEAHRLDR